MAGTLDPSKKIDDPKKAGGGLARLFQTGGNPGNLNDKEDASKGGLSDNHSYSPAVSGANSSTSLGAVSVAAGNASATDLRSQMRNAFGSGSHIGSLGTGLASGSGSESVWHDSEKREPLSASSYSGDSTGSSNGGGGGGGAPSDDPSAFFNKKALGDPKFSIAGSETDAQIRSMMGDFDSSTSVASAKSTADEWEDGIGEKNGPSLFERAHSYHESCMRKGCLEAKTYQRTAAR